MIDRGVRESDKIMRGLEKQIGEIYAGALKDIIHDNELFLKKIADVDKGIIKPNRYYNTPAKVAKWRAGFTREEMRRSQLMDSIIARLQKAGYDTAPIIKAARNNVYAINRAYTINAIGKKSGANLAFNRYDKRQLDTLMQERETPFSKIAYRNMGSNPAIVRSLTTEMAKAAIGGESQPQIIKRIRAVTGQSQYQAQRVAQTERNRVQSQARNDVAQEAEKMGLRIVKTWSAQMVNTRDTHAELNGQTVPMDQPFVTSAGNSLMYPCDPTAPAEEVINCHCVMITDVEM